MNQITEHGCLYSAEDKTLTAACKRLLQQQSFSTRQLRENSSTLAAGHQPIDRLSHLSQLGVVKIQNTCAAKKVYYITVVLACTCRCPLSHQIN